MTILVNSTLKASSEAFVIINHILQQEFAKNQKGICSTGVRHTWIQALHGYAGKELPFGDISIILRTLRAVMIRQLSEHYKVDFLGDKDPSEQQLDGLGPLWTTTMVFKVFNDRIDIYSTTLSV